jgi:TorA maturation chaperone TorD
MIVSENTLFQEILAKSLDKDKDLEIITPQARFAPQLIMKNQLDTIIIDETLSPALIGETLRVAIHHVSNKLIFLNPYQNDTVILDTQRKSMRKADDLMLILNEELNPDIDMQAALESTRPEEIAQARASMFALLAAFTNRRPDLVFLQNLRAAGIHQFLEVFIEQETPSRTQNGLQELGVFLEETLKRDEKELTDELAVEWTRLFRGLRPGYGPKPPYGYLYQKTRLTELEYLRKISESYAQHGAEIDPSQANRPDYIGLQLSFLSFLHQKASDAYQQELISTASQIEQSARDFFNIEFAPWVLAFCQEAESQVKSGFYHGFLDILQGQILEMYVD